MGNPLADERLQFFLRNRVEIREWAAIEREVAVATRELLAGLQADLDERLALLDPDVTTSRRDGGRYERIVARRPSWPPGIGVTLEWETGVDPFGSVLPKYGVFMLIEEPSFQPARSRIVAMVEADPVFTSRGFKVENSHVWPAVRRWPKSDDWWREPDAWTSQIVDALVELWPVTAPLVDRGLIDGT